MAHHFDVTVALQKHVIPSLAQQGRQVILAEVDDDRELPIAWVNVGAGEICFQEFIWRKALEQDPRGRLVVAHEIGHLVLHGEQPNAFSPGLSKKLGFIAAEESSEAQANWFAAAFLLPDALLRGMIRQGLSVFAIATLTLTEESVVNKRIEQISLDKRYRQYTGNLCSNCGQLTMRETGSVEKCDECGAEQSTRSWA